MVKIAWYPVAEPVECLPFPSKINSLDWSSHPYAAAGVGEVFGADRPYNGRKALPYAVGLTPCQPAEVFKTGEVLDESKPPQLYNADGFPLCCLNIEVARGGLLWNGAAEVIYNPPIDVTGTTLCSTGPIVTGILDQLYAEHHPSFVGYWKTGFSGSPAITVHFDSADEPFLAQCNVYTGTCASPTLQGTIYPGTSVSISAGPTGPGSIILEVAHFGDDDTKKSYFRFTSP